MWTEAHEIAESIKQRPQSLDHARRIVRGLMPDETAQVVDNVAEALYALAQEEAKAFKADWQNIVKGV